jgi:uncharacterized protein (DUF1499 family)
MMHQILLIVVAGLLSLMSSFFVTTNAWAIPSVPPPLVGVLPGLNGIFAGSLPETLGIHDGHLTQCPPSPNCVLSQNADAAHELAPISYQTDRDTARQALLTVLAAVPRTQVTEQTPNYIRVEFTSRLMGFVDDGEFYFPTEQNLIHMRSAARLGESDLGVNRRRLEQIRLALKDLGVYSNPM